MSNSSSITQVNNAVYKGRRLVDPKRMTDKYACVDECEFQHWPVIHVYSKVGSPNEITTFEPVFTFYLFGQYSPFLESCYENYQQFRCRSVVVSFESPICTSIHARIQTGIYWIPNHADMDSKEDDSPQNWVSFLEKRHTSMVTQSGGSNRFKIKYIPQVAAHQVIVEDEMKVPEDPPVQRFETVEANAQSGWMVTSEHNKTWKHRGPMVIFRRPYKLSGEDDIVASYSVVVRTVWEFRNLKNGR